MYTLVLLYMTKLFKRFVTVLTVELADVCVYQRMLSQLLGGWERLKALWTLVTLLFHAVYVLRVSRHVRFAVKFLPRKKVELLRTITSRVQVKPQ